MHNRAASDASEKLVLKAGEASGIRVARSAVRLQRVMNFVYELARLGTSLWEGQVEGLLRTAAI